MRPAITGTTKLVGLLGHPVRYSRSPRMHNLSFMKLELDYVYLSFGVTQKSISSAVQAMRTLDAKGFNVTMPIKKAVIPLLDELSPEARLIGSVNTVKNDDGRLIGYNTDSLGCVRMLREKKVEFQGKKIVVCGAGGAGRAVAIQLALEGAKELVVFDLLLQAAYDVCDTINGNVPGCRATALPYDERRLKKELSEAFMLINCTALGMRPNEGAAVISAPETLTPELTVLDIIYEPLATKLLRMARARGCKDVLNGLDMMFWQGAFAFKIWTGKNMPLEYVKKKMLETTDEGAEEEKLSSSSS